MVIQTMILLKQKSKKPIRWYIMGRRTSYKTGTADFGESFNGRCDSFRSKRKSVSYYKQCDIYVHATGYEGKSIAIQEAQILKNQFWQRTAAEIGSRLSRE